MTKAKQKRPQRSGKSVSGGPAARIGSVTDDVKLQQLRLHLQRARVAATPFVEENDASNLIGKLDIWVGPTWEALRHGGYSVPNDLLTKLETHVSDLEKSISQQDNWPTISDKIRATLTSLPGKVTVTMGPIGDDTKDIPPPTKAK
jgi:hypothetical protein